MLVPETTATRPYNPKALRSHSPTSHTTTPHTPHPTPLHPNSPTLIFLFNVFWSERKAAQTKLEQTEKLCTEDITSTLWTLKHCSNVQTNAIFIITSMFLNFTNTEILINVFHSSIFTELVIDNPRLTIVINYSRQTIRCNGRHRTYTAIIPAHSAVFHAIHSSTRNSIYFTMVEWTHTT